MGAFSLDQIIHSSQVKFDINKWGYIGQYTADTNALAARTETVKKVRSYDELVKAYVVRGEEGRCQLQDIVGRAGPRIVDAIESFATYLHPELFN